MRKKILSLLCFVFALTLLIPNVYARELAVADETVMEEGEYNSLRLVAGNRVTTKAKVDGISLVAGNNVSFEGNVTYGFYAGNILSINGTVEKDAFVAGNSVTVDNDAVIGRDLFIAGSTIKITADIGRDLNAGGDKIDISGITINGDAYIDADELIMDESTHINGTLSYLEGAKVVGLDKVKAELIETRKMKEVTVKVNFMDAVYAFLISILAAYVVMAVLFYILPISKNRLDKLELNIEPITKTTAIGLAILFVTPIICLIALFTGILTPISLITLCVYFIAFYLSKLLSAYIIGKLINEKLFKNDNQYISLLVGIVLVKLLALIPIIGFWINAIFVLYGFGLIYKFIMNKEEK